MSRCTRRALTRNDVVALVVLGCVALLLVSFWLANPRSHISPRTVCAANLSGIGKGLHTYASENKGYFPIAPFAPASQPGVGRVRYAPGMIGKFRTPRPPATAPSDLQSTEVSPTANLWTLIRTGGSTPGSFICSVSNDAQNDEDNPQDFWDFAKYSEVSYGYQVPFGLHGQPQADCPERMALAADKGPYSGALEAGKRHPGPPKPGAAGTPDDWAPWNSPNHGGEGQNVLYADSHADWSNKPLVGIKQDNIYTRWSDATGGMDIDLLPRIHGTPPTGMETPFGDTDSLIYP